MISQFETILNSVEDLDNAKLYYLKVRSNDKQLNIIQDKVYNELNNLLQNKYEVIKANSFTAKTNLLENSDIDINVLITNDDDIDIIKEVLLQNNWTFKEIRYEHLENKHYVFFKYIDKIEIEVKVRKSSYYLKHIHPMHIFLDTIMTEEYKIKITYLKKILCNDKSKYDDFKNLYYRWAEKNALDMKL